MTEKKLSYGWRSAVTGRLWLLITACLLLGLVSGHYAWALVLGLSLYLAWTFKQLSRLRSWLCEQQTEVPPPEGNGLWGEVFDGIYHLQRRNQRNCSRLQAVIDRVQGSTAALRDAVVMLDSQGGLQWWNKAAESLLGLKIPQDNGQPIGNLVRDPRFKEYFSRGEYLDPLELPAPNSPHKQLQIHITCYGNQEYLLLARDVTRVHQLEQMRKDFVANVSHELRTPLTVISGYLETLLDNLGELDPRWRRALQQMQQQSGRMQDLLSHLLLLAKLETSELPSDNQAVAVDLLLLSIRRDAEVLSAEAKHQIQVDADPQVRLWGNESELRSAFSNLLFNAVKYAPDKSAIHLRWWQDEQGAHLSVEDRGPGIEARHLPRLTERFYRVDPGRTNSTGGTGLGLAIVKHVLLRHNGRLEVASVLGKGSLFTCHFAVSQVCKSPVE